MVRCGTQHTWQRITAVVVSFRLMWTHDQRRVPIQTTIMSTGTTDGTTSTGVITRCEAVYGTSSIGAAGGIISCGSPEAPPAFEHPVAPTALGQRKKQPAKAP